MTPRTLLGLYHYIGRGAGPLVAKSLTAVRQKGVRSQMQAPYSLAEKTKNASKWCSPKARRRTP
eukprot:364615-Chlamydomonas_euryale.AAC.43